MPEPSVRDYHVRSKHQLERYAPGPGYLDWATQPDPFRTYAGAARIELPLAADRLTTRFNDVRRGSLPAATPLDRDSIATLLELSLAVSAWKSHRGASWALRCNPSSGNLHPTEGYVVCGALPGLDAGVYHYVSRDHALEQRARLANAALAGGALVGLASIYWREAWKYGIRAFRYCNHDCGHAIGAVAYAAAALGWRTRFLEEAGDADVARLLGLDRDADFANAEREAPECLLWVGTADPPPLAAIAPLADGARWAGSANTLSPAHVEWREIDLAHAATRKPRVPPAGQRSHARGDRAPTPQRGRLRRRDHDRCRCVLRDARAARAARRRTALERVALPAARAPRALCPSGRRARAGVVLPRARRGRRGTAPLGHERGVVVAEGRPGRSRAVPADRGRCARGSA